VKPAGLEELAAEYRSALPRRLARLEELAAGARREELARELHSLAGSAGTFGLPRLGEAARAAEAHLDGCGARLDEAQRAELARLLALVRQAASASIGGP
jgi:HPt (histidine-containing phosphotransfer) domain-containing protein